MKYILLVPLLLFFNNFKLEQLQHVRVKDAYQLKYKGVQENLKKHRLNPKTYNLYIRVFKYDGIVELWAKDNNSPNYKLFREYLICKSSGGLGPKRKQGDYQVPEGFYHIDRYNPNSNFHLSLGINYPNTSDKILGNKNKLGGDIFIHGDCVTVGCIPLTDNEIKSLYVYCTEAINNGQNRIPVTIFPAKMEGVNTSHLNSTQKNSDTKKLWIDLQKGYTFFNKYKKLPNISFLENGRHHISTP